MVFVSAAGADHIYRETGDKSKQFTMRGKWSVVPSTTDSGCYLYGGNLVEGYVKGQGRQAHDHWPKGGAVAVN